jgi:hypothetical protein
MPKDSFSHWSRYHLGRTVRGPVNIFRLDCPRTYVETEHLFSAQCSVVTVTIDRANGYSKLRYNGGQIRNPTHSINCSRFKKSSTHSSAYGTATITGAATESNLAVCGTDVRMKCRLVSSFCGCGRHATSCTSVNVSPAGIYRLSFTKSYSESLFIDLTHLAHLSYSLTRR